MADEVPESDTDLAKRLEELRAKTEWRGSPPPWRAHSMSGRSGDIHYVTNDADDPAEEFDAFEDPDASLCAYAAALVNAAPRLTAAVARLSKTVDQYYSVIGQNKRLPAPELEQDVAFAAFQLGRLEDEVKSLRSVCLGLTEAGQAPEHPPAAQQAWDDAVRAAERLLGERRGALLANRAQTTERVVAALEVRVKQMEEALDLVLATPEWNELNGRRADLIGRRVRGGLNDSDEKEYRRLQDLVGDVTEARHPRPPIDEETREALRQITEKPN